MSNKEVVLAMCRAWSTREVEQILSYLSDDCFYHNIPMSPLVGAEAIRGFLEGFVTVLDDVEFVVRLIGETAEGAILTERLDRLKMNDAWIELPVMGAFEVRSGKISSWRDYYDQRFMDDALAAAAQPAI